MWNPKFDEKWCDKALACEKEIDKLFAPRWWWPARRFIKNIIWTCQNIKYFGKVVLSWRWWDSTYTHDVLIAMLERAGSEMINKGMCEGSEDEGKDLLVLAQLIRDLDERHDDGFMADEEHESHHHYIHLQMKKVWQWWD